MGAAGQPRGCIQQITGGLTQPQLYKASRQEVRTTGRQQVGRSSPPPPPPAWDSGRQRAKKRAGNRGRAFSKPGGREQSPPAPQQSGVETGFTEPTPAELGLELSLMTLSPVLSLHRPCAASSGEDREQRFPAHVGFVSKLGQCEQFLMNKGLDSLKLCDAHSSTHISETPTRFCPWGYDSKQAGI